MKTTPLRSLVAISVALSGHALALIPVTDNFSSAKIDETKWYHYRTGTGKLSQKDGKLTYSTSKKSDQHSFATIELTASYPRFDENWEMIIDLSNTSDTGKKAGCGFMICNAAPLPDGDRRDYLYVEFYGKSGIAGGVNVNGKKVEGKLVKSLAGINKGSIRVRFDATTKLFTFHASLKTAAQGYDWIKVGTFSPTGSGGNVNGNWKMGAASYFGIQLLGFGAPAKIAAGKITHDNFSLKALP